MVRQIGIELETPGDSLTMFRLRIDGAPIAADLTAAQAHVLVGEILERITLPKSSEGAPLATESDSAIRVTARRRAIELSIGEEDLARLFSIARSRTEPASRVERARMLLAYRKDPSFFAVGQALGVHHQTVQRCVERALAYGPMAALDDRPRPGKEPTITAEARTWLVSLACRKAKDLGYPHELLTTRLLARHAREHGPAEGHACLGKLVQGGQDH